jgi:hypothetical protein
MNTHPSLGLSYGCAGLFGLLSILCYLVFVVFGSGFTPLALFNLGCGFLFGLSTVASALIPSQMSKIYFSIYVQLAYVPKINLVNSLATFTALSAALALCCRRHRGYEKVDAWREVGNIVARFLVPGFLCTTALEIFQLYSLDHNDLSNPTFLVLQSIVSKLTPLGYFFIFMGAVRWTRTGPLAHATCLMLLALSMSVGLVELMKEAVVAPILCFLGGLWTNRSTRKASLALICVSALSY